MRKASSPNTVRIIGGEHRSRRVRFASREGLRPTPDRVRETLFNWLNFDVPGARCLDLFAGSGVLGFEAASRGAAQVDLVERDPVSQGLLREAVHELRLEARVRVHGEDALSFLARPCSTPYAVVFLDPPYALDILEPVLQRLHAGGWVSPGGAVYFEQPETRALPALPEGWTLARSRKAGEVGYHLARFSG
ncbi:MAG: 16S rRNA (guanine(966)-N(2))-methyltransferase RsmD [Halothiobacillaceae bacterium]|nr:16S rRNA (guanine(966)-N(2))-methyltransferase RsmD [Halothiobacillaceae bacterium]